jgi:hypothetical protein
MDDAKYLLTKKAVLSILTTVGNSVKNDCEPEKIASAAAKVIFPVVSCCAFHRFIKDRKSINQSLRGGGLFPLNRTGPTTRRKERADHE